MHFLLVVVCLIAIAVIMVATNDWRRRNRLGSTCHRAMRCDVYAGMQDRKASVIKRLMINGSMTNRREGEELR